MTTLLPRDQSREGGSVVLDKHGRCDGHHEMEPRRRARARPADGKESRILQPVSPVLVTFSAILLTSVVLLAVDSFIDTEASGIYLSIAGDRDGDALRQHCWRPDLVRQRLGSGVLLLSSEVQLFYF